MAIIESIEGPPTYPSHPFEDESALLYFVIAVILYFLMIVILCLSCYRLGYKRSSLNYKKQYRRRMYDGYSSDEAVSLVKKKDEPIRKRITETYDSLDTVAEYPPDSKRYRFPKPKRMRKPKQDYPRPDEILDELEDKYQTVQCQTVESYPLKKVDIEPDSFASASSNLSEEDEEEMRIKDFKEEKTVPKEIDEKPFYGEEVCLKDEEKITPFKEEKIPKEMEEKPQEKEPEVSDSIERLEPEKMEIKDMEIKSDEERKAPTFSLEIDEKLKTYEEIPAVIMKPEYEKELRRKSKEDLRKRREGIKGDEDEKRMKIEMDKKELEKESEELSRLYNEIKDKEKRLAEKEKLIAEQEKAVEEKKDSLDKVDVKAKEIIYGRRGYPKSKPEEELKTVYKEYTKDGKTRLRAGKDPKYKISIGDMAVKSLEARLELEDTRGKEEKPDVSVVPEQVYRRKVKKSEELLPISGMRYSRDDAAFKSLPLLVKPVSSNEVVIRHTQKSSKEKIQKVPSLDTQKPEEKKEEIKPLGEQPENPWVEENTIE